METGHIQGPPLVPPRTRSKRLIECMEFPRIVHGEPAEMRLPNLFLQGSGEIEKPGSLRGHLPLLRSGSQGVDVHRLNVGLRRTRHGKALRAVVQNTDAAQLMGIDVRRTVAAAFMPIELVHRFGQRHHLYKS